jgi:SAM-dependent methyltransferase
MASVSAYVMDELISPPQSREIVLQKAYHDSIFEALLPWEKVWQMSIDMAGSAQAAASLGIDLVGHFGPRGVTLVLDQIVLQSEGPLSNILELGSGFGGALRLARRHLLGRGLSPRLTGIELVSEYCSLASRIGRVVGDAEPLIVNGDARQLPLRSGSIDAVFATGSAPFLRSMNLVLSECARVLRPGGVLVMTDEVGLRPDGQGEPDEEFLKNHPPEVVEQTTIAGRQAEIEAAGLVVETMSSLLDWALPLVRQRVLMLRFMAHCAIAMFGNEAYEKMVGTLTSAAQEYERGRVQPMLLTARLTPG